jgi:predicted transcriptional regulator
MQDSSKSSIDCTSVDRTEGCVAKERKGGKKRGALVQGTLRLSETGAGMLLGDLEHSLMEAAWTIGRPATAREIHAQILKTRPVEPITAVTVLNRLVPKRLMTRRKIGDVYHYSPILPRAEFMQRASRDVMERVLALGPDAVAASIVDVLAEQDPERLAELGRLVRRKLREQDEK